MDAREGGYIKFYRSIEDSEDFVGLRPDQCWVAIRIAQMANFKPGFMRFRGQAIPVGRGELGHTLETIARRTGASIKVVRTTVSHLVQTGFLGTRTGTVAGTSYRILIVRNYDRFQGDDDESGTVAGTVAGSDRARDGHETGTKRKKGRREEGEEEKQQTAPAGAPGFKAAQTRLVDAFFEAKGAKYLWQAAKDSEGLKRILALGVPLSEIEARWRAGLKGKGWNSCASIAQLAAKWNDLAKEVDPYEARMLALRDQADRDGVGVAGHRLGSGRGDQPAEAGQADTGGLPSPGAALQAAVGKLLGAGGSAGLVQDWPPLEHGPQLREPEAEGAVREP